MAFVNLVDETKSSKIENKETSIVPAFLIEVIPDNDNDQINAVYRKLKDYEKAKVELICLVFPVLKEVHIHVKGKKEIIINSGMDLCTATSVIPGFELSVEEIFE